MKFLPHDIIEIVAAGLCFILFLLRRSFFNTWLLPLLFTTVLVEQLAKWFLLVNSKLLLYNIFTLLECLWYVLIIRKFLISSVHKRIVLTVGGVLLVFSIINLLFVQGPFVYNNYSRLAYSMMIVFTCLLLFIQILLQEVQYKIAPLASLLFIVSGLFLFYCGNFILYFSFPWMVEKYPKDAIDLYRLINQNLNVVLYALISLGLITECISQTKAREKGRMRV